MWTTDSDRRVTIVELFSCWKWNKLNEGSFRGKCGLLIEDLPGGRN